MVTVFALGEILTFALAGFAAAIALPGGFWLWTVLCFAAYLLLAIVSRWAFSRGAEMRWVLRDNDSPTPFFIHPSCPLVWLVKRYIRANPDSLTRLTTTDANRKTLD